MRYVSTRGQAPRPASRTPCWRASPATADFTRPKSCRSSSPPTSPRWRAALCARRPPALIAPFVAGELGDARTRRDGAGRLCRLSPPRERAAASSSTTICSCSNCSTARRWRSRISPCNCSAGLMNHALSERGRARDDRRRDLRRHRRGGDRGLRRPRADRRVHPLSARPGVRRAAPADDDGRPAATSMRSPIEGTFDDCQDIVKGLFGDLAFRDRLALSGVNSINWARILAQIVYYFTGAVALGAPRPPRLLRRADRQFRRRARRLLRQADGAAGRAADDRHQRERHSGARAGQRRLRAAAASSRRNRRRWTFRFRRISSGCCSRPTAATRAAVRGLMASLAQSGEFSIAAGAACSASARFRRRSRSTRRMRSARWRGPGARAACSSIRIRRSASTRRARRWRATPATPVSRSAPPIPPNSPTRSSGRPAQRPPCRRILPI